MKQEKQYLLDEVVEPISKQGSFVILSYSRVKANAMNGFRREIASLGGDIKMMRKTILMKAFSTSGIEMTADQLPGHIGIVFSGTDAIETLKRSFAFSARTDKGAKIIGGHIDGKLYNANDVQVLSTLPGKDEMRAQLLATLVAPMSQGLAVIDAVLSSVIYCLDNKSKEGETP